MAAEQPVPVVSIVVVAHGTGLVLAECVEALAAHTAVPHEIVVVDNPAPGREPAAVVLEATPAPHRLLTMDDNVGFAGGNEVGVAVASGRYLAFVNPDAVVGRGWLEPLVAALGADPTVGVAAPVLRDPGGGLQEAGQILCDDGWTGAIGGPWVLTGDESQCFSRDVDYASAACWVVRREEHVARGGFDTAYHPAFYEDVDYALRVERDGQVTRLVAAEPVVHLHGGGGAGRGEEATAVAARSFDRFRGRWTDRIARSLPRPVGETEGLASRDRACADVVAYVLDARRRASVAERTFDAARSEARERPRGRVMLLVADAEGLDVTAARRDGLDVVIGDVERTLAVRGPLITAWRSPPRRFVRARRAPAAPSLG